MAPGCQDYPLCGHPGEIQKLRERVAELEAKLQEKGEHTLDRWEWRQGFGWVERV